MFVEDNKGAQWNSDYGINGTLTNTTIVSTSANIPEVVAGSESTASLDYTKTRTTPTATKNQINVIVDNWRKTIVTKPAVSITSDNIVYKDTKIFKFAAKFTMVE